MACKANAASINAIKTQTRLRTFFIRISESPKKSSIAGASDAAVGRRVGETVTGYIYIVNGNIRHDRVRAPDLANSSEPPDSDPLRCRLQWDEGPGPTQGQFWVALPMSAAVGALRAMCGKHPSCP